MFVEHLGEAWFLLARFILFFCYYICASIESRKEEQMRLRWKIGYIYIERERTGNLEMFYNSC